MSTPPTLLMGNGILYLYHTGSRADNGSQWLVWLTTHLTYQWTDPWPTWPMTHDLSVAIRTTLASAGISCSRGVSVCLSVRLSQAGVLLKRLNVGSHKQRHTIAQGL